MVFALKIWHHYLYGFLYIIYVGHKSLRYLMDKPNLDMRHRMWLDVMKDYDCDILYHLGKANVVVDALNCKAANNPIVDVCLRMTMITLLLEQIHYHHGKASVETTLPCHENQ